MWLGTVAGRSGLKPHGGYDPEDVSLDVQRGDQDSALGALAEEGRGMSGNEVHPHQWLAPFVSLLCRTYPWTPLHAYIITLQNLSHEALETWTECFPFGFKSDPFKVGMGRLETRSPGKTAGMLLTNFFLLVFPSAATRIPGF